MKQYNIIIVFSPKRDTVLMCRRTKSPYKGMLNFVGGKIEKDEDHRAAAFRELWEETGITRDLIQLVNVMNLSYPMEDSAICEVWAGELKHDVPVSGSENPLLWVSVSEDFSDVTRFAGEGNIHHMMKYIGSYHDQIFGGSVIKP